jgi:hypothetical protein
MKIEISRPQQRKLHQKVEVPASQAASIARAEGVAVVFGFVIYSFALLSCFPA